MCDEKTRHVENKGAEEKISTKKKLSNEILGDTVEVAIFIKSITLDVFSFEVVSKQSSQTTALSQNL